MANEPTPPSPSGQTCDHGLEWLDRQEERLCALEYLNRFIAPHRVEHVSRRGGRLFLVFDSGEKLECCCEDCGESHAEDHDYTEEVVQVALGRRALRFRLEDESGNLIVWFARGDHLHLHRNALLRFRPARPARAVRPRHVEAPEENPEQS